MEYTYNTSDNRGLYLYGQIELKTLCLWSFSILSENPELATSVVDILEILGEDKNNTPTLIGVES